MNERSLSLFNFAQDIQDILCENQELRAENERLKAESKKYYNQMMESYNASSQVAGEWLSLLLNNQLQVVKK